MYEVAAWVYSKRPYRRRPDACCLSCRRMIRAIGSGLASHTTFNPFRGGTIQCYGGKALNSLKERSGK